jgi:hypothetical protein
LWRAAPATATGGVKRHILRVYMSRVVNEIICRTGAETGAGSETPFILATMPSVSASCSSEDIEDVTRAGSLGLRAVI